MADKTPKLGKLRKILFYFLGLNINNKKKNESFAV